MSHQSKAESVAWFKKNEPFIYQVAKRRAEMDKAGLAGWGDFGATVGDIFSKLGTTVSEVAPKYLQYKQQKKIMDMQLKRAEQNLPPANVADYTPAIKIQPEITPETEKAITRAAVQTTESAAKKVMVPLAIGGAILGGFLLMKKR